MKKKQKEKKSWFIGLIGIIFLFFFAVFIISYFKNVSISEWVGSENHLDKGEQLKQTGLFFATMVAFSYGFNMIIDFLFYLPLLHKKKKSRK